MSVRRRYSQWDVLVTLDQRVKHGYRPRILPRLGGEKRSFERFCIRYHTPVVWCAVAAFIANGLIDSQFNGSSAMSILGLLSVGLNFVFIMIAVCLLGRERAGACTVNAHARVRLMRHTDRQFVAFEIARRRETWRKWLDIQHVRIATLMALRQSWWRAQIALLFLFGTAAWHVRTHTSTGILPTPTLFSKQLLHGIYGAMYLAVLVTATWNWQRTKRKLRRSLGAIACADCGYPAPAGETATTTAGVEVKFGPERCTECGAPWPLVPPGRSR